LVLIGGKQGVALVDSGSTDSFIDYTFASKIRCAIVSTAPLKVKVAGGGYLDTSATTTPTPYIIQQWRVCGKFKLLQLKGYDVIFGCDWIKTHSPISLDLRDSSRQLSIIKDGKLEVVF
jgi:hypothetical protein